MEIGIALDGMDMNEIENKIAAYDTVSLDASIPGYPVFVVSNASCTAKVALHGAHLFDWTPTGQDPVIYNSPDAIYREGKAIRGGIPICWPWFNAHPTDPSLPSHGIARNRFWSFLHAAESEEETTLVFQLESSHETKLIWPHDFTVTATIKLGAEASLSLTTLNTGAEEITVGGALHTYLQVEDMRSTSVSGLDEKTYLDTVGEHTQRTQDAEIVFEGEVDRIYKNTTDDIVVHSRYRNIKVERSGSTTAVVWNPWIDKAAKLGDLPDEAYQNFVCIEAANALDDVHVLKPQEEHTLATTISVVP